VARAAPPAANVVKRAGREPEFPKEAAREGLTRGSVRARVLIDGAGNVTSVDILDSRPSRVFDRAVRRALMDWKFNPGTENRNYEAEIDFKREN
jgi:protein TonB